MFVYCQLHQNSQWILTTKNASLRNFFHLNSCKMVPRSRSRGRSRSGCVRLAPAVYCKAFGKKRRKRSKRRSCGRRKSSRRRSRRRSKRGKCGRRRGKRRGRSRRKKRKCGRPGPKTNNPFLNFMRVFRRKKCGWPACKIAIEGAKCWCRMNKKDKMRFYREACSMRKKKRGRRGRRRRGKRRGGCGKKRRRRKKSRRRKRSCL